MKRKQILALLLMLSLTQVAPIMGHEVLAKETNESTSGVSSTFANSIKKHMQDVKQNENDIVTGYTTCSVNIRSEPDIKSEVVMILKYGDEIKYIKDDYVTDECNYTWNKIIFQDKEFYICSEFISQTPPNFVYYDVPLNGIKSFMSYKAITSKSSPQYKLQNIAYTGNYGIRQVNGRYCIAIGSYFTTDIGLYIDLILENGEIIPCILGDCKDDKHTDSQHILTYDGSLAEFIVDTAFLNSDAKLHGDISKCDEWDSTIVGVKIYDEKVEL